MTMHPPDDKRSTDTAETPAAGVVVEQSGDAGTDVPGFALHQRLLAGDVVVTAEIYERYAEQLVRFARSRVFDNDRDTIASDLVVDLLMEYFRRPEIYQPERGRSLRGFFYMALKGDIKNWITKQSNARKHQGEMPTPLFDDGAVGNIDPIGNIPSEELGPEDVALQDEVRQSAANDVAALRAEVVETDEDRIVFDLKYLDQERNTTVYALALGKAGLTAGEQRDYVERIKDRLDKRVKRYVHKDKLHER